MAPLRVGLTGGIGSGKSTVAALLADHGALVIDADQLAREVVAPGSPGLAAVAARFGDEVLTAEGALDRRALGAVVFADPRARRDLEQIVHPLVRERAAAQVAAADHTVVIQMIPLLVETGQHEAFDLLVVVDLPVETQRQRLAQRDHLSQAEISSRLAAQATRGQRLQVADLIVDNSRGLAELDEVTARAWQIISRRALLSF